MTKYAINAKVIFDDGEIVERAVYREGSYSSQVIADIADFMVDVFGHGRGAKSLTFEFIDVMD